MKLWRFVRGFFQRSPFDRVADARLWAIVACRLRGHAKRHRSLMVQGRLFTWSTCRRCGRHLSGEQPPWGELLSRAVNRRMVAQ